MKKEFLRESLIERVKKSRLRLTEAGGRRMPSGYLQPDAAAALTRLVGAGYAASHVAAISAAIIDAEKKLKK